MLFFIMWRAVRWKTVLGLGTALIVGIFAVRVLFRPRKQHKMPRTLETISEFKKPSVYMRNPQRVSEMVAHLIRDGMNKLQVIADFDFTLSRYHNNGMPCETCHGALESSKLMTKQCKEQSQKLFSIYHPLEMDHETSLEDKARFMLEWWEKSHDVLQECTIQKSDLESAVRESKVVLRDGVASFLDTLYKHDVPLLILSAGLGDLLVEAIRQQACLHANITTVANFMEFDSSGQKIGFKKPIITSCNKNASSHGSHQGYFDKFSGRTNAILLGDSLGDLTMDDGILNSNIVLKIGFLNQKKDESLAKYLEGYDIVLSDDQTMDLVNGLLSKMI